MPSPTANSRQDQRHMRLALRLARRRLGHTRPNPPVGAVIVKDGQIIGQGYHLGAGHPHAEVAAVASATASIRGATIYITLEPCSTHGRTPPCTDLILASGFKRVCIGTLDPNPAHAGRGVDLLRAAGVEVTLDICRRAAAELIAPFARRITSGLPLVTLKLAMTLDGRLADRQGRSKWITGTPARRWVQRLRRSADAVMVGAGTASADDPDLRCRLVGAGAPWRVVVSASGDLPPHLRLFTDSYAATTLVATTAAGAQRLRPLLGRQKEGGGEGEDAAAAPTIWTFPGTRVPLEPLLRRLADELGVMHLVCEGGGHLAGALLADDLIDRAACLYAPMILGDAAATPAFAGTGWLLPQARRGTLLTTQRLGDDLALLLDLRTN